MKKQQAGFTLIELIVVILILSILGATALPKFLDVTEDAHDASVAGVGGGFSTGIALAHAQWIANGSSTTAGIVQGYGTPAPGGDVWANGSGWPTDDSSNTASCIDVWNGVLQGGRPSVGVAADTATADAAGLDYYVTADGGATCTYIYTQRDTKNIAYNSTTGAVTVTN